MNDPKLSELECSMCGRNGGPSVHCTTCGGNQRFAQKRAYTLSEERMGIAPTDERYGPNSDVGPKKTDPLWLGTEE